MAEPQLKLVRLVGGPGAGREVRCQWNQEIVYVDQVERLPLAPWETASPPGEKSEIKRIPYYVEKLQFEEGRAQYYAAPASHGGGPAARFDKVMNTLWDSYKAAQK